MNPGRVIVIGGGEHARVLIETIRAGSPSHELLGFVDPQICNETTRHLATSRLGGEEALARYPGALGLLGFGALEARNRRVDAVQRLTPLLGGWATVIHSSAWVSPSATWEREQ